jgi:hypothetical protein
MGIGAKATISSNCRRKPLTEIGTYIYDVPGCRKCTYIIAYWERALGEEDVVDV